MGLRGEFEEQLDLTRLTGKSKTKSERINLRMSTEDGLEAGFVPTTNYTFVLYVKSLAPPFKLGLNLSQVFKGDYSLFTFTYFGV